MKITVNGNKCEFSSTQTIYSLLVEKGINPSMVVVEHNYEIVDRTKWQETLLKEGDNLEIVKFIGGG